MNENTEDFFRRPLSSSEARFIARALQLEEKAFQKIAREAELTPRVEDWKKGLDLLFLLASAAFFLAGILCFLSFNWADLSKFAKFAILQGALLGSVAMAWWKGINELIGQIFLFSAAIFVGFLLAVFGQVYQTGADSYSLFFTWLVFITLWTPIGKQQGLIILFIVLANLSLIFYWNQMISPSVDLTVWIAGFFGPLVRLFIESGLSYLPLALMGINILFILAFELIRLKNSSFKTLASLRVSATMSVVSVTSGAVSLLFREFWQGPGSILLLSFFVMNLLGLWYFRYRNRDLYTSALILISFIVFSTSFLIRSFEFQKMGMFYFLFIGIAVLVQTALAAGWLKLVNTEGRGSK